LNCKQTFVTAVRFQGYVFLSPLVVHITMDECIMDGLRYRQPEEIHRHIPENEDNLL